MQAACGSGTTEAGMRYDMCGVVVMSQKSNGVQRIVAIMFAYILLCMLTVMAFAAVWYFFGRHGLGDEERLAAAEKAESEARTLDRQRRQAECLP